jgi:signal transduction histidine kinase/ligand-binding sensor domain-containing protein
LAVLLSTMLVLLTPAPAAPPQSPFERTRHVAWTSERGAPGNIQGLAQSTDGFLWLASATGLYRFDGVSFERIALEGGDGSQSLQIASVAAAPNGDVWIGYDWGGMAVFSGGHLRPSNPGKPDKASVYLAITRDGAVWARTRGGKGNQLVRFHNGRWTDIDSAWNLPPGTNSTAMMVARDGSLYLVNPDGVRRLRPGARRFEFQLLDTGYGPTIAEDPQGRIWLANAERLFRIEFGQGVVGPVTPLPHSDMYRRLTFDADGSAWLAGAEDGVRRLVPDASGERFVVDRSLFGSGEGLSSQITLSMLRDSEGNIWTGTLLGLDRFSARHAIRNAGLPLSYAFDSFAGQNGEAYLISNDKLFRVGPAGLEQLAAIRSAETICGDRDGIVVASPKALFAYSGGKVRNISLPTLPNDDPHIYACGFDPQGRLLIAVGRHPLYRLEDGRWRPIASGSSEIAYGVLPASDGSTLLIYPKDRVVRLVGDRTETLWTAEQGSIGFIKTATRGKRCVLLGGQNALGCLRGGTMKILTAIEYPELTNVSGIIEMPQGWTWLIAHRGIMRVRTDHLYAAFDSPGRALHFQSFGAEDGLAGETMMMHPRNVVADRYGRLWFFTNKGLVSLDIARAEAPPHPPRVVIKSLTSAGRVFAAAPGIVLPVGTQSLQIDYTATALTDPEGTRFRYRLEGVDADWIEAGDRRQAFYNSLAPGAYRFRVAAISSAGTPSRDEAVIQIEITPSFVQTWIFKLLCVALLVVLGTMLYRWRVRSLSNRVAERMQERLDERERIARELHDTLLQGVSGLLLQFQGLAARIPVGEKLRQDMESALDRAEDLVVEGRNRVRNLRASDGPRHLEDTLALALVQPGLGSPIVVKLERSGTSRQVTGLAATELAAVAVEARTNAIRHGGAATLIVTMSFSRQQLELTLEDDGSGISPAIAAAGSRPGHYGLIGMRERVERLQGTLQIAARQPVGTRIDIIVPARCAYPLSGGFLRPLLRRLRLGSG